MKHDQADTDNATGLKPIFDAHLDLAWNAVSYNRDQLLGVNELRLQEAGMTDVPGRGRSTVTLPELKRANVRVCVATLLARSGPMQPPVKSPRRPDLDHATAIIAHAHAHAQLAYYRALEDAGVASIIRTAGDLGGLWTRHENNGAGETPLGLILSMEGTDPMISAEAASAWWDHGLRVAGLSHYGPGRYAAGTGARGGLTIKGKALLKQFERLGIILDVTHLTDEGLDQSLDLLSGPVIASHHNCRALVPGDRQLSDDHIRKLINRGGMIGIAMDAWMLYPDWERGVTSRDGLRLTAVADHVDHICQIAGNTEHVGIGSDLDGGFGTEQTPEDMDTVADLQKLDGIFAQRGYSPQEVAAIFHGNWLNFFHRHLP